MTVTATVTRTVTATSTATATPPLTLIFSDGFESGSMSAWTSSGGLAVQTALAHSGRYAAQGNTTNGGTYAKKTLPSTYTDGYARIYFNLVSYTSQVNLLRFRTAADGSLAYLYINTAGRLALQNDVSPTSFVSTASVSAGSGWHSLEFHAKINGAASQTEVWLDGTPVGSLSLTLEMGTTPIGKVQIGEVNTASRVYNVVFDDVGFNTQRVGP
jgi:hypothetical protein